MVCVPPSVAYSQCSVGLVNGVLGRIEEDHVATFRQPCPELSRPDLQLLLPVIVHGLRGQVGTVHLGKIGQGWFVHQLSKAALGLDTRTSVLGGDGLGAAVGVPGVVAEQLDKERITLGSCSGPSRASSSMVLAAASMFPAEPGRPPAG